jgi:predicted metal-dependent enzyme (double-stranded beta helix superfamily)
MSLNRLKTCVQHFTRLVDGRDEDAVISQGSELLADLIAKDDWLPRFAAEPDAKSYRQYLLHCDPLERFSIVSFVWGPGQQTPVHNHTVWGLIGVLRGSERSRRFVQEGVSRILPGDEDVLMPGQIDIVSPKHGDIHQVSNGLKAEASISIQIYGGNEI